MMSTEELRNWARDCHSNVSIHAFDSTYRKFLSYTNKCSDVVLVYYVKDHHCFPITDEKLKLLASKANQGGCDNLLKHMFELKWTRRHENIHKINKLDDIFDLDKKKITLLFFLKISK